MPLLGSNHPKGTWDDDARKIVVTPCCMSVRGNFPLANTKTYYWECKIELHFRNCVITLQNFAWLQHTALLSAACDKREYERGKIRVCVLCHCCAQQHTHTNTNFSSFIFSFDMCSTVKSTVLESCKILQSHDTISKMQLNDAFSIICFCVCKWNVTSDTYTAWGYKKNSCTIIPNTLRMNATQKGHFWLSRGWS